MPRKIKPVHPGEMLREEFMKPYGLSMKKMAMDLHVPVTRIAEIVNERRGITADTALRLGRYFKNSAEFWMNMQKHYELEVAKDEIAAKVERDVHPFEPASTRQTQCKWAPGSVKSQSQAASSAHLRGYIANAHGPELPITCQAFAFCSSACYYSANETASHSKCSRW
jgi:addiction module HigA family antidote